MPHSASGPPRAAATIGYTNDPTELVVLRETQGEEKRPARLVLRVHMEHVAYPHIAVAIGLLERYYCPMGIGEDNGGNGLAVVQELATLDKFRSLDLGPKLSRRRSDEPPRTRRPRRVRGVRGRADDLRRHGHRRREGRAPASASEYIIQRPRIIRRGGRR